jgi:hypothetical protein
MKNYLTCTVLRMVNVQQITCLPNCSGCLFVGSHNLALTRDLFWMSHDLICSPPGCNDLVNKLVIV